MKLSVFCSSILNGYELLRHVSVCMSPCLNFIILKGGGDAFLIEVSIVHGLTTLWGEKASPHQTTAEILARQCDLSSVESQPGWT